MNLQRYVDEDIRHADAALTDILQKKVIQKWNDLKRAGTY
jgi:hypothetical protein